jgi:hypothetical protein
VELRHLAAGKASAQDVVHRAHARGKGPEAAILPAQGRIRGLQPPDPQQLFEGVLEGGSHCFRFFFAIVGQETPGVKPLLGLARTPFFFAN